MAPVQEPTEITEKSQLKFKITKKKRPEPKPEPAPEKQPQMFKVSLKKVKKRTLNYAREVEEWVPEERLQEIVQDGPTEIVRIIEDSLLADTAEGEEVEVKKSKPAKKKKPEPKKKEEPEEKTEMFKISLKKVKKRPIRYAQECEEWNSVEETEDFVSDAPAEIISFVDDEVEDASDLAEVLEETVDVQQAKAKTKRTKKPEPKPKEAEKKLVPFTVSLKKVKKKPIHYAREAEEWVSIEEVEDFEPELATEVVQFDLMDEEETIEASVSETDILKSKAKKKKRPIQKMEDKPEETPEMFKMTLKKVPKKPTKIEEAKEEEKEVIEEEKDEVSMEVLTETIEMSAEEVVEEGLYGYWFNLIAYLLSPV